MPTDQTPLSLAIEGTGALAQKVNAPVLLVVAHLDDADEAVV